MLVSRTSHRQHNVSGSVFRPRCKARLWCHTCSKATKIVKYSGQVKQGDLMLTGISATCAEQLARLLETAQSYGRERKNAEKDYLLTLALKILSASQRFTTLVFKVAWHFITATCCKAASLQILISRRLTKPLAATRLPLSLPLTHFFDIKIANVAGGKSSELRGFRDRDKFSCPFFNGS